MNTPHCLDADCKAAPTYTVQRLWMVKGKHLPLLYCCDAHKPGRVPLPDAIAHLEPLKALWRVEPIADAA